MNKRTWPELPELLREAGVSGDRRLLETLAELSPPSKAPPQLLRERLLATVARPRLRFAPFFGALAELFDLGDSDLAGIFERAAAPSVWTRPPIPNTELLHLVGGPRAAGADNGLVRLAAGARFPMHRHLGLERVVVLAGSYRDEQTARVYAPGERHEMAAGTSHAYVALPGESLLLAVSVVTGVDVEGVGAISPSSE